VAAPSQRGSNEAEAGQGQLDRVAPVIRDEIWRTLAELKGEGLAQIVIDKNVGRLLHLADRHVVIEKGRVMWQGNSDELRAQPDIVHQYLGV
jgi:branched-chain amino acid transport system ATP-binding protein